MQIDPDRNPQEFRTEMEDLIQATNKILDFMLEQRIENLIILDRSARFISPILHRLMQFRNIDSRNISIFFVDHDRFMPTELRLKAGYSPKKVTEILGKKNVIKSFENEQPYLFRRKQKPTLLLDEFVKSGVTLRDTKAGFIKAGFSVVRTASIFGLPNQHSDIIGKIRTEAPFFYNSNASGVRHKPGKLVVEPDRSVENLAEKKRIFGAIQRHLPK